MTVAGLVVFKIHFRINRAKINPDFDAASYGI